MAATRLGISFEMGSRFKTDDPEIKGEQNWLAFKLNRLMEAFLDTAEVLEDVSMSDETAKEIEAALDKLYPKWRV